LWDEVYMQARLLDQGSAMSDEWVVTFVDMQGSTAIKYEVATSVVQDMITRLYRVIYRAAQRKQIRKFTGDGAMVAYVIDPDEPSKAPLQALQDASKIIQHTDRFNYVGDCPPVTSELGLHRGSVGGSWKGRMISSAGGSILPHGSVRKQPRMPCWSITKPSRGQG
jgi:class 3 adenylate cyclase